MSAHPIRPAIRWSTYWLVAGAAAATLTGCGMLRVYLAGALLAPRQPLPSAWRIARLESPTWIVWMLLLPALVLLCDRFPIRSGRDVRRLALHALVLPGFHAALAIGTRLLNVALAPAPRPAFDAGRALFWIDPVFTVVLYASVTAILHLVRSTRLLRDRDLVAEVAAREQARLSETVALLRVESLQRQLQPHFLFNTLNTISSLVTREPVLARQPVARLGALLRRVLAEEPHALVPLAEELDFLRDYLALQEARFRQALAATITVTPEAQGVRVPWMLLQPLVENAIEHGTGADGVCRVAVLGRVADGRLELVVEDRGPGFAAPAGVRRGASAGLGLHNTRERLATLFGDRAALRVERAPAGGARVVIELPGAEATLRSA